MRRIVTDSQRTAPVATLRENLEARTEVLFAYLHGSFAEGLPFRDIDLAISLDEQQINTEDVLDQEAELSVNSLDIETLKTKARVIRESLRKIKRYVGLSDEEFWSDERNLLSVKLLLIQCVEDAAAMCGHLVARLGGQGPPATPDVS